MIDHYIIWYYNTLLSFIVRLNKCSSLIEYVMSTCLFVVICGRLVVSVMASSSASRMRIGVFDQARSWLVCRSWYPHLRCQVCSHLAPYAESWAGAPGPEERCHVPHRQLQCCWCRSSSDLIQLSKLKGSANYETSIQPLDNPVNLLVDPCNGLAGEKQLRNTCSKNHTSSPYTFAALHLLTVILFRNGAVVFASPADFFVQLANWTSTQTKCAQTPPNKTTFIDRNQPTKTNVDINIPQSNCNNMSRCWCCINHSSCSNSHHAQRESTHPTAVGVVGPPPTLS